MSGKTMRIMEKESVVAVKEFGGKGWEEREGGRGEWECQVAR